MSFISRDATQKRNFNLLLGDQAAAPAPPPPPGPFHYLDSFDGLVNTPLSAHAPDDQPPLSSAYSEFPGGTYVLTGGGALGTANIFNNTFADKLFNEPVLITDGSFLRANVMLDTPNCIWSVGFAAPLEFVYRTTVIPATVTSVGGTFPIAVTNIAHEFRLDFTAIDTTFSIDGVPVAVSGPMIGQNISGPLFALVKPGPAVPSAYVNEIEMSVP